MAMARLGQGPFQIVDFWAPDHTEIGPDSRKWEPDADPGRCACCGKKVAWRVIVMNTADGLHHVVGRDCAKKAAIFVGTTDDQLKAELKRIEKAYKRRQEEAKAAAEETERIAQEIAAARVRAQEGIEVHVARVMQALPSRNVDFLRLSETLLAAYNFELHWEQPLFPELGFVTNIRTAKYADDLVFAME